MGELYPLSFGDRGGALSGIGIGVSFDRVLTLKSKLGTIEYDTWRDGWTVVTQDRKRTAQFEHTVLVTADGHEILTCP